MRLSLDASEVKDGWVGDDQEELLGAGQVAPVVSSIGSSWQIQVVDGLPNALASLRPGVAPHPAIAPTTVSLGARARFTAKQARFEVGVDGLRIVKEGKRRYFLPGDAFVFSILGLGQLRRHVGRLFPGEKIEALTFQRFRSISFVSGVEPGSWVPLYRGLPPVHEVKDASLLHAARAGTKWIADSLQPDERPVGRRRVPSRGIPAVRFRRCRPDGATDVHG